MYRNRNSEFDTDTDENETYRHHFIGTPLTTVAPTTRTVAIHGPICCHKENRVYVSQVVAIETQRITVYDKPGPAEENEAAPGDHEACLGQGWECRTAFLDRFALCLDDNGELFSVRCNDCMLVPCSWQAQNDERRLAERVAWFGMKLDSERSEEEDEDDDGQDEDDDDEDGFDGCEGCGREDCDGCEGG